MKEVVLGAKPNGVELVDAAGRAHSGVDVPPLLGAAQGDKADDPARKAALNSAVAKVGLRLTPLCMAIALMNHLDRSK